MIMVLAPTKKKSEAMAEQRRARKTPAAEQAHDEQTAPEQAPAAEQAEQAPAE